MSKIKTSLEDAEGIMTQTEVDEIFEEHNVFGEEGMATHEHSDFDESIELVEELTEDQEEVMEDEEPFPEEEDETFVVEVAEDVDVETPDILAAEYIQELRAHAGTEEELGIALRLMGEMQVEIATLQELVRRGEVFHKTLAKIIVKLDNVGEERNTVNKAYRLYKTGEAS